MNKYSLFFFIVFCTTVFAQEKTNTQQQSDVTMLQGAFGVTVGGNFPITGTFPSYMNERVDQFVTRLFNNARAAALARNSNPELMERLEKEYEKYSFRDITLKRVSGEVIKLDLLKFRRTGDFSMNPYLSHDDVLIFPPTDIETNFFTISGAVMEPGKFHFVDGDKLSDAIELAGGFNKAYEDVKVKIYRISREGDKTDLISLGVNDNFALIRGDRIVLDGGENQRKSFNVMVIGEVKNPGTIPISKSNTTLKEVLERAGGIKETASIKNSRLYTGKSAAFLLERLYGVKITPGNYINMTDILLTRETMDIDKILMLRLSGLTEQDTGYFSLENQVRFLAEGSAVDFMQINDDSSEAARYIVKNGDIIIIPEKKNTVYVFGNINHSGNLPFIDGQKMDYYIHQAGGLSEYAEKDEIYLIKGNTRRWILAEENPVVEEGDYIFVQKDQPRSFNYYVDITSRYLGILGSAATVILLLVQFGK